MAHIIKIFRDWFMQMEMMLKMLIVIVLFWVYYNHIAEREMDATECNYRMFDQL